MNQKQHDRITELLEMWFEPVNTNVVNSVVRYKINNRYMKNQCYYFYKNAHHSLDFEQFVCEYIFAVYKVLVGLKDLSSAHQAIGRAVCKTIPKIIKKQVSSAKTEVFHKRRNGKLERVYVTMPTASIDALASSNDEEFTISKILTDENSLVDGNKYQSSVIKEWFLDNKSKIMQKTQLEFWERLNELPEFIEQEERKELLQATNPSRTVNRIVQRIVNYYNNSKPNLAPAHLKESERLVRLIKPITNIAKRERDIHKINEDIFDYIADNFDDIQPLVKLKLEEHQAVNRRQFNTLLVYKLFNQLEPILKREADKIDSFVYEPFKPIEDVRVQLFSRMRDIPDNLKYANLLTNGMLINRETGELIQENIHFVNQNMFKKGDKNGEK